MKNVNSIRGLGNLSHVMFGILMIFGIIILFLMISNNAEAGDYGVEVNFQVPPTGIGNVTPGVDYLFSVNVTNTGASNPGEDINFTVQLDNASLAAGWTVTPSGTTIIPNLQMGVENSTSEIIIVRAPSDALYQDSATINVSVDVIGHKTDVGGQDSLQLRANVIQVYDVLMTTTQDNMTVDPGSTASFFVKVTNKGNGVDTFSFSDIGPIPGSWSEADVTLGPKEFAYIYYNISIPSGQLPGDSINELTVASVGSPSTTDTLTVTAHVNVVYDVRINGSPSSGEIVPGTHENFSIFVENLGTGDDTIKFNVKGIRKDWAKIFYGPTEQYQIFIPAGGNATMTLRIEVPSDELIDTGIIFTVNASSMGSGQTIHDTFDFLIDVGQYYDGHIISIDPSKIVDPGQMVVFQLQICNDGNGEDSFIISVENAKVTWGYIFEGQDTIIVGPIPPGTCEIINMEITPSEDELQGSFPVLIRMQSVGDPSVQRNYTITVAVDQIYGVELQPSGPTTQDIQLEGGSVQFNIKVYNMGNGPDTLGLSINSDQDYWVELSDLDVSPDPHDFITITVWLNISSRTEWESKGSPDPIFLTIEVETPGDPTPTEGEGTWDNLTLSVNIIPVYGLTADVTPSLIQNVDIGYSVFFDFTIHDTGTTAQRYRADIMSYDSTNLNEPQFSPSATPFPVFPTSGDVMLQMSVTPEDEGLSGSFTIWVRIVVHEDDAVQYHVNVTVNINEYYNVQMEALNNETNKIVPLNSYANYTLIVTNTGNAVDKFYPSALEPYAQLVSFEPTNITLGPGSSGVIICRVFTDKTIMQTNNLYDSGIPSSIRITSQGDPDVFDSLNLDTDIPEIHSLAVSSPDNNKDFEPGEMDTFILYVENQGTVVDRYTASIVSYDSSVMDTPSFNPTGTFPASPLAEGTTTILEINVQVLGTDPKVQIGDYYLTIKVQIDGYPGIFVEYTFTVHIDQYFEHTVTTDTDGKTANIDEIVEYILELKNKGNDQDTYKLSAVGSYSELVTFSTNEITLIQEETTTFKVFVETDGHTVDRDDLFGKYLTVTVKVISKFDPSGSSVELSLYTTINHIYDFTVSTHSPQNTKEGKPGYTIQFAVEVRNIGSATDQYKCRITMFDSEKFPNVDITDINVNVDRQEFRTTTATIEITGQNDKAEIGTWDIEITVTSNTEPTVEKSFLLHVKILPEAGLDVSDSQANEGEPGDVIDYKFRVTNQGNSPDTFDLTLEGTNKDWGQIYDPTGTNLISEITLSEYKEVGYFADIILRVTIPGAGETYADQIYPIDLKVTSRISDSVSVTRQANTKVNDFVDLKLEYIGSGDPVKDYDPNKEAVKFSFRITNYGNQVESGAEIILDPADWDYSPESIIDDIDPGATMTFALEFEVPHDTIVGQYDFEVYLKSSVDPTIESNRVDITVNVTKPDLAINSGDISGLDDIDRLRERIGNAITISAEIKNQGTSDARDVQVRLFQDNTLMGVGTISSILAGESRNIDFRWTVIADEVEIRIEITPIEEIEEDNNEASIILDLRPDLQFDTPAFTFSDSDPDPGEEITITAHILNTGGDAEDVIVRFFQGNLLIGTDTIDIDSNTVGNAQIQWEVPDSPGRNIGIRAEIDHFGGPEIMEEDVISVSGPREGSFAATLGLPLLILFLTLIAIACIGSLLFGLHFGRSKGQDQDYNDYQEYEEYEEYEDYEEPFSTPPPITETTLPPPPPPPPPPEELMDSKVPDGEGSEEAKVESDNVREIENEGPEEES